MLVIDIQGFFVLKKFVPKELAAYDGEQITHVVFKPPFNKEYLTDHDLRQSIWLEKHYHGILWNSGLVSLEEMEALMKHLCEKHRTIYVKGKPKTIYLQRFSDKVQEYPNEEELALRNYLVPPECSFHNIDIGHCALSNVKLLYKCIQKYNK